MFFMGVDPYRKVNSQGAHFFQNPGKICKSLSKPKYYNMRRTDTKENDETKK